MGCSAPCGFTITMFGRRAVDNEDIKQKFERKLYIAKESPEPVFDLAGCGLKQVPSGIYSICKVFRKETLRLDDNVLSTLENGGNMSDLYMLKTLNISKNRFHRLDDTIKYLVNLKDLNISQNELKYLPDSIGSLTSLQMLNVSQNRLKSLPTSLGNLKHLRKLILNENDSLSSLCKELCGASNLMTILLDADKFAYPPREVIDRGTIQIMKFLAEESGVEYAEPLDSADNVSASDSNASTPIDPFKKDNSMAAWEEYERNLIKLESQIHEAGKIQRQNFLENLTQEQTRLDGEVWRIQQQRDGERLQLIKQIQEDEEVIGDIVSKLMDLDSSNQTEQFLEYDRREQERLIEMCKTNADIRTMDTLKAMQAFLEEECLKEKSMMKYGESRSEVQHSFLIKELESSQQLNVMLIAKDERQTNLVERLLRDEDVQKAAVASLLERVDSRSWSLVQEISIVESNLAKLSAIEMDKRKFHLDYNMQKLSDQRLQLSYLLVELLTQQDLRRGQLMETLKIMELEKESSPNFWLRSYQQLLDSIPDPVITVQRTLDPLLANNLLQEGVIHCLPFLVQLIQSPEHLETVTLEDLKTCGVVLSSDRSSIMKAIQLYLEEKKMERLKIEMVEPSAPSVTENNAPAIETPEQPETSSAPSKELMGIVESSLSECVICMDESCAVVFIPCGHLCCCEKCAGTVVESCPMCRGIIDRKIRVMLP